MLKKRLVACLILKNGIVVQSIGFKKYLPVGSLDVSVEFLNMWGIDEIVVLDIDATSRGSGPDFDTLKKCSGKGFVPLSFGGGVRDIEDMKKLVHFGADKVVINKAVLEDPDLIARAAEVLGNQCIVVSMDVKKGTNTGYEVYSDSGKTPTGMDPVVWAQKIEFLGGGEIFLNSIDRDGTKKGYDLELIKNVSEEVAIPVIACGGVGHPEHFLEGLVRGKATAVAAGNYFHFTEHSPITSKEYLRGKGINVRLDTYADYADVGFDTLGRISKRNEGQLEKLRFEHIPEEII